MCKFGGSRHKFKNKLKIPLNFLNSMEKLLTVGLFTYFQYIREDIVWF